LFKKAREPDMNDPVPPSLIFVVGRVFHADTTSMREWSPGLGIPSDKTSPPHRRPLPLHRVLSHEEHDGPACPIIPSPRCSYRLNKYENKQARAMGADGTEHGARAVEDEVCIVEHGTMNTPCHYPSTLNLRHSTPM